MSGIYIPGISMPPKDGVYTLRIWGTGQIERLDGYHSFLLSGVKAVPVPDHGRLIDADALLNSKGIGTQIAGWGKMYHETVIEYAPTVIPADGKEA